MLCSPTAVSLTLLADGDEVIDALQLCLLMMDIDRLSMSGTLLPDGCVIDTTC